MSDEPHPAGFPNSDVDEAETKKILLNCIDPDRVKLTFETRDKYPNRDGFVEMTDEKTNPVGDIVIQVKKLNEQSLNPPKHQTEVKTLIYSEAISPPLLILGVDVESEVVYWKHISQEWVENNRGSLQNQGSMTIHFSDNHILDGESREYIQEWTQIAVANKQKIQDLEEYQRLKEIATPALGKEKAHYSKIHEFLDEYDRLRSNEFQIVQRQESGDTWCHGYADGRFQDEEILFGIYPIPQTVNDVQIKEINPPELANFDSHGIVRITHKAGNPVRDHPKKYAKLQIRDKVENIIEKQSLDLSNSPFLIREVVYAFVDEYYNLMGLSKQDEYDVDELHGGFFSYLQNWLDAAISSFAVADFRDFISHDQSLSPGSVSGRLPSETMERIHDEVETADRKPQYLYPVGTHRFTPQVLAEAFDKVGSVGDVVKRPYVERDQEPPDKDSWKVWEEYSPDALCENVNQIWKNLPNSYHGLIQSNFPEINDSLDYFKEYAKILVILDCGEKGSRPTTRRVFLSNEECSGKPEVEVVMAEDAPVSYDEAQPGDTITLSGCEYKVRMYSAGASIFFLKDPPVFGKSYEVLDDQIGNVFP